MQLNSHTKKSFLFLLLAALLYSFSFLSSKLNAPDPEFVLTKKVEAALSKIISDYDSLLANEEIMNDVFKNKLDSRYLEILQKKPYSFLIYKGTELVFWNENKVIPPDFLVNAVASQEGNSIKLENGYYEISKSKKIFDGQDYSVIRLILLKHNFSVENNFLKNSFNPIFELPDYTDLSLNGQDGGTPVNNRSGKALFYLESNPSRAYDYPDYPKVALFLLALASLLFAVFFLLKNFSVQNAWIALLALVSAFTFIRWLTLIYNFPHGLYDFNLFNPQLFASSALNKSLGDLAINLLMLFWIVVFFYRNVKLRFSWNGTPYLKFIAAVAIFLLLFFSSRILSSLFESLLLDSKIPFDLNDFLSLNIYSFIGLGCLTLALSCFTLISAKFIQLISAWNASGKTLLYATLLSFLIYLGAMWLIGCPHSEYFAAVAILLLVLFLQRMVLQQLSLTSLSNMIALIAALSMFSSIYLYHFNQNRDLDRRKALARKLSIERDLITEYLFIDVQKKILNDLFIRNYFRRPFISTQEIVDRVINKYFSGFFRKYDVHVYTLNTEGKLLRSTKDEYLELLNDELLARVQQTESDYLFYIPKASGSYAYISNLPIIHRGKLLGSVVLELTPKTYSQANLYPELLLEEKVKPPDILDRYSYALYSLGSLVKKSGNYAYPHRFPFQQNSPQDEFYEVKEDALVHLVYNASEDKEVIITGGHSSFIQPISLFSYLFCIYLLFGLSFVLLRYMIIAVRYRNRYERPFSMSFRDKIQFSMIFIIIFSFFVIGYVTISHFASEFESTHNEHLIEKQNDIRTAIEYILKEDSTILSSQTTTNSPIDLSALSDIHGMDINIYDSTGKVLNTSQPEIFEKGVLSSMMEPTAFKNVALKKKTQFIQNEQIGNLHYLSIYSPIRNYEGNLLAYLNLPYFAKERELNNEISALLITLVNVYVLLLVLAGVLAYLLSDSVTRSLSAISEKLKLVKLTMKNEPIEWKSNDEIGTLVAEYNKMISELEKSALLLAKSERESAWREMAKQIAHEIKNPLTPMKLSIQHLQRSIAENDPRAHELAKKVSVTLIEQIDNLAHIANEFSSFAKMPKAQNEVLNIADVIENSVNLFSEEKHVQIQFNKPEKQFKVFADKNQLLSAFNNLVKNASQAIPFEREGIVQIELVSKNGSVIASVKDNGIGISSDQAQKVFTPNFTTKSSGSGLGLALTREIIENANGKIWFESTVNTGTTFFIELPEHK
ncbi:MAG: ATP-binding protein [Chitinophagales bacterium]|nr:ATP-binding protein [Chitinophagales bacterium]